MYKIDYKSEGNKEYIIISTDEELSQYQIKMLQETDNELIDIHVRNLDNKAVVYYDITDCESLKERCANRRTLDFMSFIKLITGIVDNVSKAPRLLLNPDNLLLQSDYIFIKDESVKLIYLPFNYDFDIKYQLRELILYLLLKNVALKTDTRVNRFIDYLQDKGESIDIIEIQRFLIDISSKDKRNENTKDKNNNRISKKKKNRSINYRAIFFLIMQIFLLGIITYCYFKFRGYIREEVLLAVLFVLVFIYDIVAIKLYRGKKDISSKEERIKKQNNSISKLIDSISLRMKRKKSEFVDTRKSNIENNRLELDFKSCEKNTYPNEISLDIAENDATVLLDFNKDLDRGRKVIFKSLDHEYKDILIEHDEFLIGRYPEVVSYNHQSMAVGRRHLIIKGEEIIDLDSKNGTYVNGCRLIPNEGYPLNEGDELRIANVSYSVDIIVS